MIDNRRVPVPFDIIRCAHAALVCTDLARARAFYVDLLGLVLTEESADALYLRGYEERVHHSLVLRKGDEAAVDHLAFRVADPEDLQRLDRFFAERRRPRRWVEPGEEAGQGLALRVQDPLGFPVEFFCEMESAERLLQRFDLHRGAQIMRIDHFNCHVPDCQAAFDYYRELGFRCSEYTVTDAPAEQLWAAWMYRKPNVHDIALMNGTGPRLHHVAFWVADTQSVLRACDVLAAVGAAHAIERGPGRHGLSNAFFLYLRDPDGHRIELYTGDYWTGDPDWEPIRWSINDPRRATFWGHWAPKSWFEESSRVLDLEGRVVPVREGRLAHRPQTVT